MHIVESARLIAEWRIKGRNVFLADALVQGAFLWRLQTMAESATQLSDDIKSRHAEIDWRGIRGFRNIMVHGYVDVLDLDLTWAFVEREVDALGSIAAMELADAL